MKRRQLLAVTGTVAVAGCLADSSTDTDEPDDGNESPSDEQPPEVDTTVTDATLETRELDGDRTETAVTGLVENTSDARLGLVSVAGKFYDADGQLLSSSPWDVRDLEPGQVWEPWIPYMGEGDVDHAELVVTDATAHSRTIAPNGMVLESHDMQIPTDDLAMPRVLGTVSNQSESDVGILQARLKTIADNGNLLETGIASIQNFGAGESWDFDQQIHFKNPDWKERIGGYQIVLTA
ncbi:FxLYD domain-containing protein [Natrinema salsiterrestre]|uniref:FxLYD domain-containing protein n=1 Tax=Natrinema salsiterrestre TaxID=2950540 RepID=A0A9Q4L6D6_9EURY|nr:FxLYD domain-containing protein [Natrinema salsiterrestre]MDF9748359.1 FxLYD domain-containing protein [Natrinema salsiterrestre]